MDESGQPQSGTGEATSPRPPAAVEPDATEARATRGAQDPGEPETPQDQGERGTGTGPRDAVSGQPEHAAAQQPADAEPDSAAPRQTPDSPQSTGTPRTPGNPQADPTPATDSTPPSQDTPPAHPYDRHPERAAATSGKRKGAIKGPTKRPEPRGGLLMGRPFGVPVYVAPSWFLVAALITWVFGGQLDRVLPELGAARYLVSLFFAIAFYASVLIHELAHTVVALRYKLPVRRIQLQFFGGVSEIEKESETPGREFMLAFVGPLLSLVLSGVFYAAMRAVEPGTVPGVLLAGLMISNLIVAAFNLLPGLPLDGGRMLRAVVWKLTGKPMSGTIAAAWVGRALAVTVLIGLPLLTQSGTLGEGAEEAGGMDTLMDALLAAILAAIIWTGAATACAWPGCANTSPTCAPAPSPAAPSPSRAKPRSPKPCAGPTRRAPAPSSSSTPTATPTPSSGRPRSSASPNTAAPGSPSAASPRTSPTACASPPNSPAKNSSTPSARPPPPNTSWSRRTAPSTESSPRPTWNAPSSRPWPALRRRRSRRRTSRVVGVPRQAR